MDAVRSGSPKEELPRTRLLAAFADSVASKGYAATTIADVVARAHVSRRTFYEHFADKEAALLASHAEFSKTVITSAREAAEFGETTADRIRSTITAIVKILSDQPAVTKTHFVETLGAGPRAREARRTMQRRFEALLISLAEQGKQRNPQVRVLSPDMATAITGGLTELIVQAAEDERLHELRRVEPAMIELVTAALLGKSPADQ